MKTLFTLMLAILVQTTVFSQVSSLSGLVSNDRVDLKWETNNEKNVSHFIVEKSIDGKEYQQAGIVFAFGNTTETKNYPFFEKNIKVNPNTTIYYRVSLITDDGIIASTLVTTVKSEKRNDVIIGKINTSHSNAIAAN